MALAQVVDDLVPGGRNRSGSTRGKGKLGPLVATVRKTASGYEAQASGEGVKFRALH